MMRWMPRLFSAGPGWALPEYSTLVHFLQVRGHVLPTHHGPGAIGPATADRLRARSVTNS